MTRKVINVSFSGVCPCGTPWTARSGGRRYCSRRCQRLVLKHDPSELAELIRIRDAGLQPKVCACGQPFTPKNFQQNSCTRACMKKRLNHTAGLSKAQREKAARAAARANKVCADCANPIPNRGPNSPRCATCQRNRELLLRKKGDRARKSAIRQSLPNRAASTLKQRKVKTGSFKQDEQGYTHAKLPKEKGPPIERAKKPVMVLPNFGGDWYPGWDGPWSPSIPPEGRALIEKYFGPAPYPKQDKEAA
jgi:hypothetical protein